MSWFDVDKEGLAKLLEERGKAFALFELIQNAWDQKVTSVDVKLTPIPGKPFAELVVEDDDPDGFRDLAHAYTLFAESDKKTDATKRGRFNLGEKLVLALCSTATITSTKGGVQFMSNGDRRTLRTKRDAGSVFEGQIRMTREEYEEVCRAVRTLIPPVPTTFNGERIPERKAVASFEAKLPTLVADDDGVLRRRERTTTVTVYESPNEPSRIYEMGIPVVDTGDKWHVDIGQKVPLNMDRDNVPPGYLQKVRTLVLNHLHDQLDETDLLNDRWMRDAAADGDVKPEAVSKYLDLRFGPMRVAFDPSDPEANSRAVAEGYTVIKGGMLSGEEWANVKRFEAVRPAGQVTPTSKPYSDDPNAPPVNVIPQEKWTKGMLFVENFSRKLGLLLMDKHVSVRFVHTTNGFAACYGNGHLDFNLLRLGNRFFDDAAASRAGEQRLVQLLIHEFGHEYEANHLSEGYHDALCSLGAKLYTLLMNHRGEFE